MDDVTTVAQTRRELALSDAEARARLKRSSAAITERERQALELLIAGATYDQIGRIIGVSRGRAAQVVSNALHKRAMEFNQFSRDQAFVIYWERLEKLFTRWFPLSLGGARDPVTGIPAPPDPEAAKMVMGILDRMSRTLGFDAPKRVEVEATVEVTGPDPVGIRQNIMRSLAEMEARAAEGSAVVEGELVQDLE